MATGTNSRSSGLYGPGEANSRTPRQEATMRRLEFYLAVITLLAAIILSSFALWVKLDLNQTASAGLIKAIDDNSTKSLTAIAAQVKAGLDKSDGIATAAKDLGTQNKDLGDQNKRILDEIAPLIKNVQAVTQEHTETIKKVQKSAVRAEQAANTSAAASKKAIRVITQPKKKNIFGF